VKVDDVEEVEVEVDDLVEVEVEVDDVEEVEVGPVVVVVVGGMVPAAWATSSKVIAPFGVEIHEEPERSS